MSDEVVIQFSTTRNSWDWWPPFFPNYASWLIRHVSHSPFSHGDLELPGGALLGASNSPKAPVIRGNPCGVAVRPPDYENYGRKCRMVIETPLAEKIRATALTQLGKPFDNKALYRFLSDAVPTPRATDWLEETSWYCFELLAYAFYASGYWGDPPNVWPNNRVSGTDLMMIFLFDPRWSNRETFWDD